MLSPCLCFMICLASTAIVAALSHTSEASLTRTQSIAHPPSSLTTSSTESSSKITVVGEAVWNKLTLRDMVTCVASLCGLLRLWRWGCTSTRGNSNGEAHSMGLREPLTDGDPSSTDPGLLKKHTIYKSYATSVATYPKIRLFLRPHAQADKLPNKPKPLPLLVFIHGLGGSIAQFNNILTSLVNVGPCLGIDLPGCGLSCFEPKSWEAYSHAALVELLGIIIEDACQELGVEQVVLVCHSAGCSLAVSMVSNTSSVRQLVSTRAVGLIAICPKASVPTVKQVRMFRRLLSIPTPIFDLWRAWDRRGAAESASVARFVGDSAPPETKKLQVRYNSQSKTDVWRRIAWGSVPSLGKQGKLIGGLPGPDVWAGVACPLFLIAGESDKVTKPEETAIISKALGKENNTAISSPGSSSGAKSSQNGTVSMVKEQTQKQSRENSTTTDLTAVASKMSAGSSSSSPESPITKRTAAFKVSLLPAPAGHALLYDFATYRTLSGLIQSFMSSHVDSRLSLGWQLQHLKDANKWDVKNLAKWKGVPPVSEPIAGIFRAMKTLREVDEVHSPSMFVRVWGSKIKAVIDISYDAPVYDPQTLDDNGIEYNKFPTVSKIPPTQEEVRDFLVLVDRLRSETAHDDKLIGVHCHYGFNRTGFFICSYLIERFNYSFQQAIDEFQARRAPGIRHNHFLDTLSMRYHRGLQRAPTL